MKIPKLNPQIAPTIRAEHHNTLDVHNGKITMTQKTTINWTDDYLLNTWFPKIFNGRNKTFEDYLYSEGVVSGRGGIKLPEKYRELTKKWVALGYARERLERKNGFTERKKQFSEIKSQLCRTKLIEPTAKKTEQELLNEIETVDVSKLF